MSAVIPRNGQTNAGFMDFVLANDNFPFTLALGLMILVALFEGLALLLGVSLSHWADDVAVDHAGAIDADAPGLLDWLHVGRVPLLVLLVLFLTAFGLSGLLLQAMLNGMTGHTLAWYFVAPPATLLALPVVRFGGFAVSRLIPREETSAVSEDALIGRIAVVTTGTARNRQPAEVRLHDAHGQSHYVMVEPENAADSFPAGTRVLIVRRLGATYRGILSPGASAPKG